MTGCVAAGLLPAWWGLSVAGSALLRGKGPWFHSLSLWLPPNRQSGRQLSDKAHLTPRAISLTWACLLVPFNLAHL